MLLCRAYDADDDEISLNNYERHIVSPRSAADAVVWLNS